MSEGVREGVKRKTTVLTITEGLVDDYTDETITLNMTHTQMCSCFFFLSILMRSKERGRRGREE